MEGMAWRMACWCMLTASRNNSILVSIGSTLALWWPKTEWNKDFWHSKKNTWKDWSEMWHVGVSWPHPEIIPFWPILAQFWPSDSPRSYWNGRFSIFLGECMEGMFWNVACWYILTTSRNYSILAGTGPISTVWWPRKWVKLRFPGILIRMHGRKNKKCRIPM